VSTIRGKEVLCRTTNQGTGCLGSVPPSTPFTPAEPHQTLEFVPWIGGGYGKRPIIMHREKGWTSLPTLELLLTWLACLIEALTACSRVGKKKGLGSVKKPCQDTVELQRFIDHRQVPTVWYDFQP
jgi:hypothetical protein